jgi:hypothetical protein
VEFTHSSACGRHPVPAQILAPKANRAKIIRLHWAPPFSISFTRLRGSPLSIVVLHWAQARRTLPGSSKCPSELGAVGKSPTSSPASSARGELRAWQAPARVCGPPVAWPHTTSRIPDNGAGAPSPAPLPYMLTEGRSLFVGSRCVADPPAEIYMLDTGRHGEDNQSVVLVGPPSHT